MKLEREDFDLTCIEMAKFLLGKFLVRKLEDGTILKGKIVETESYLGRLDKASHSYGGRKTPRNEPMYMSVGTAYVYMTYGIYHCFNISSKEPGAAVLIRAVEPTEGLNHMHKLRLKAMKSRNLSKIFKDSELCNGPSKLCMSLNIHKEICNKLNLLDNDILWLENPSENLDFDIVPAKRIGIDSAGEEWAMKPLRFYIFGNTFVSKRDLEAEKSIKLPK
ncbi:DNA-3-methyladenine glycosylase-like [Coccinella septempunctata]|uniref:DNA-3-methyladenine glycosylase-like n=1 Tax=Coccinella septempunctata TaxID=41139 RepID=UPI001D08F3DB|nr:DNA-3-methyladenine glycosylase-like [Coccinella septempunctata]XP_044763520.1 DNA-3-methyladenine glycosylase-like [Coccinella septempunctata]XP_044763521.1 DNA-3-methyladenine glycosylase-like [Coccinella septempunctata]